MKNKKSGGFMENFTPQKVGKFLNRGMFGLIGGGIFLIILLATSVYIVDQTEQAVITRFGKYVDTKDRGLHFKLPFGIDRNYTVNVTSIQTQEFRTSSLRANQASYTTARSEAHYGETTMLTGDLNIVDVEWTIQYLIVDPRAWVFNVYDKIPTIRDISRSAINMLVGDRAIMDIMMSERSAIGVAGMDFMNDKFKEYGLGINVITVEMQDVLPPVGDVRKAFNDVNVANQDRERLINEGQEAYNREIPKTKGEAASTVQVAKGYAIERVNIAKGDVARFNAMYDEYRRSPEVTRQRIYYEMIEDVFKDDKDTVIIDRNLRNFLPLMNLQGGSR
jgi:membrane protease subunit HflK